MPIDLELFNRLATEWKSLQPLPPPAEEKLWQKLRLEWNYHSNHIEGNTLTYGETELLLLHDQTSGTHTTREYDEMKGHDFAIELVRRLASDTQGLTEAAIRELNQILLKEPFFKEAITPTGEPTRKQIIPGQYKQSPNSVRTVTGALFHYAEPMDVPPRMAKLVQDIRSAGSKDGLEFLAAIALVHHEFTLIHPFDDGNGRVARLLTNYILLRKGLLPLVIPSTEKETYLAALRLADVNDPATLTEFFTNKLVWSLELGIKGAKGKSLEEPSDIEKEIALFVREQRTQKKEVVSKSSDVLDNWLKTGLQSFLEKIDEKIATISELFESKSFLIEIDGSIKRTAWRGPLDLKTLGYTTHLPTHLNISVNLNGYCGKSASVFGVSNGIHIELTQYEYQIIVEQKRVAQQIYAEPLQKDKEDKIISLFLKGLLEEIRLKSERR